MRGRGDWVLCQVTSKSYGDAGAIKLENASFASGSLHVTFFASPGKLFTANRELIVAQVADLKPDAFARIIDAVVVLLRAAPTALDARKHILSCADSRTTPDSPNFPVPQCR